MYFTERIQNTLLKPEILKAMSSQNGTDTEMRDKLKDDLETKKKLEQKMTHTELMKVRQEEAEIRKKERVEKLQVAHRQEILQDPQFRKDKEKILEQQFLEFKTVSTLVSNK